MAATSPSASPPVATATATASGRPHPSYTKMITQALAELGGTSGRAAIAAFILGRFTGLPATHDALLSAHLRRLVAEGVVRIYGSKLRACYVFPASDTRGRGRPRKAATRLPKNLNLDDDSSGSGSGSDDDDMIWPAPLASCVNPDWDPNSAGRNSGSQPQQNSVPNLDGFQSNTSDDDVVANSGEHDDDDEYTPARAYGNRGRGHRMVNLSANGDASSVTKRGRGRPRKLQKDGPSPSPSPGGGDTSTGIKRGRGRPRKEEQQSQAKHPPTPPASRRFKVGCGRPMLAPTSGDTGPPRSWRPIIIEKLPPARWSVDPPAASAGVKRPRGRPRMYRPMPAKTGDELENPVSVDVALENPISVDVALENPRMHKPSAGDIVSMLRKEQLDFETEMPAAAMPAEAGDARSVEAGDATRAEAGDATRAEAGDAMPAAAGDATPAEAGDAIPAKAGDATPAEAGDARPAEAGHATPAETGGAASEGIKRPRGRPRKEKPAAAMPAQAGDAASAGIKRGCGRPRKEKPDSASAGIKRGRERPRKYNPAAEDGDAVSTGMKGPLENPI